MQEESELVAPPNLDDVLGEASSQHAWRVRWGVAGVTVAAALVLLAQIFGPRLAPLLTAQSVVYPSAQSFEVASNVTWATFAVNGHPMSSDVRFTVKPTAQTTISVYAPPFTSRHCILTVPVPKTPDCPILSGFQVHGMQLIAFRFSLSDLPVEMRGNITSLVNAAFAQEQPQTPILPGAHYALGDLFSVPTIATQTLDATLTTTHAPPNVILNPDCMDICAPDDVLLWTTSSQPVWHAQIYVLQQWHFRRQSDGAAIGRVSEWQVPSSVHFDLLFDSGQWTLASTDQGVSVADAIRQPLCKDGYLYVQSLYFVTSSGLTGYASTPHFTDQQLGGCLIQLDATDNETPVTFFWHTGALYAVNPRAQQAEPDLPLATKQDLAPFSNAGAQN